MSTSRGKTSNASTNGRGVAEGAVARKRAPNDRTHLVNAAIAYAEHGFHVFPVRGDKSPLTPDGFYSATRMVDRVEVLFSKGNPAGVGIVPGLSGHVVLDVDPRNGGETENLGDIPSTWTVATGDYDGVRGTHFWFALPEGQRVGKGKYAITGVDYISSNGYVLAPPSAHPSGVCYEDLRGSFRRIAPIPPLLVQACNRTPLLPSGKPWMPNGQRPSAEVAEFLRSGGISIGGQTDMVCRAARSLLAWGVNDAQEITEQLFGALAKCDQNGADPWAYERVEYIVADLASKPPSTALQRPNLMSRPWTDLGNAERFSDYVAGRFRYVREHKRWFRWDGTSWSEDVLGQTERTFFAMARELQRQSIDLSDDEERARWIKHSIELENTRRSSAAMNVARSLEEFAVSISAFDRHANLLNFSNGVYDLETHTLREHTRDDLLSKVINYSYVPSAAAPTWERIVRDALADCEDKAGAERYLQKALGYALGGELREHLFFYLYGPPGSSKSTIVNICRLVLGDYGGTAEPDIFLTQTQRSEVMNALSTLQGKRLVHTAEMPQGTTWKTSQLNRVVEGEQIYAKKLYADVFTFAPQFTLFFTANHRPRVKSPRDGIWRRIRVIPFNHEIPKDKQDPNLVTRILLTEAEGVLAWLIEGHRIWQQEGFKESDEPSDITDARKDYEHEESPVSEFLEAMTLEHEGASIGQPDLHEMYLGWHATEKRRGNPIKKREFNREVAKQYDLKHTSKGEVWQGLRPTISSKQQ